MFHIKLSGDINFRYLPRRRKSSQSWYFIYTQARVNMRYKRERPYLIYIHAYLYG